MTSQWVVHHSRYGATCSVAVYAPNETAAVRIAQGFLEEANHDVSDWNRSVWPVDSELNKRIWHRTRKQKHHVMLLQELWP